MRRAIAIAIALAPIRRGDSTDSYAAQSPAIRPPGRHELDTAESASCLGIHDENVRVRLHRARQTLALRLASTVQQLDGPMPDVWRFDGDRCARTLESVMARIAKP